VKKFWTTTSSVFPDRHLALQAGVGGLVDLTHPAYANLRGDFVGTEAGAWGQRHAGWR